MEAAATRATNDQVAHEQTERHRQEVEELKRMQEEAMQVMIRENEESEMRVLRKSKERVEGLRRENQEREEKNEKERKEAEEKLEREWKEKEEELRREYKAKEEKLQQEKEEALAGLVRRRKEMEEQVRREKWEGEEQLKRENKKLEEEQRRKNEESLRLLCNKNQEEMVKMIERQKEEEEGGPGYPPGGERPPSNFQNPQLIQFRGQIMAYRMLARHQPLPPLIAMAATGKREPVPPCGEPVPPRGEEEKWRRKRKADQLEDTNKKPTAPECPVCFFAAKVFVCLFIERVLFLVQVCLDEMAPPTKIFHCVNGHHICQTCK